VYLARIQAPVAVVLGEFVTREHADRPVYCIAGAERIVLPEDHYFALLRNPGDFNRALPKFVARAAG
jgi:hypothetical protein